jgi:hypothetical protein
VKVAYVFSTSGHTASYKLGKMILPQLEQGMHGVEVVGLFFFDDNNYILRKGEPGTFPSPVKPVGTVAGVRAGCVPDLYTALAGNMPDQVITL